MFPTQANKHTVYEAISLYYTVTQNFRVGALRWSSLPTPEFLFGDTNMLVSKNAETCVA